MSCGFGERRSPMRWLASLLLLPLLAIGSATRSAPDANLKKMGEFVIPTAGLWVVPDSQVSEANDRARAKGMNIIYAPPDPFYFDGETATMYLSPPLVRTRGAPRMTTTASGRSGSVISCTGCRRLGAWEKQAAFRNGRFVCEQSDVVWHYERVPLNRVNEDLQPLVKKREKHDYSITPHGNRDPERLKHLE